MKTIIKRLADLEEQSVDRTPFMAFQDEDGTIRPPIPDDIGDRPITIVRWATEEEATPDPSRIVLGAKGIGEQA